VVTEEEGYPSVPCSICGKTVRWKKPPKSKKRLPSGWKRHQAKVYCDKCWGERFILRAVSLPVASPLDCTWDELNESLHALWAVTTQASNWLMTELYAKDVRRFAGEEKMPAMAGVYLYPKARERFPDLPSQTVAAMEKAITQKYKALRKDIIWTCRRSLPTYRYPSPFPIPGQGWSIALDNGQPIISVPIGGKERIHLRLRGAAGGFHRQLKAVKQIVSGEAEQGQVDIYRQGHGKGATIMVKMVAWLPRTAMAEREVNTLFVRSTAEAMAVALNVKDEALWTYHGNQIPGWSIEHKKRLQDWADDTKAEHRPTPPFERLRNHASERYHHRMQTAAHELAAMIVNYAVRRRFRAIRWDDSIRTFAPDFVWADLKGKLATKADAASIELIALEEEVSGETVAELSD
jgi:hypothetical protein